MAKFKVGEICVGVGFISDPEYNDIECEVKEISTVLVYAVHPKTRTLVEIDPIAYYVEWCDGDLSWVHESNLKKKRPPMGKWEDVERYSGWNPAKVKA